MRLNWLTLHWERLARRDPFFAVLTDVDRRFGGHDLEGFYRSGTEEIAAILRGASVRGLAVPRQRALDFGCGVGRLTHALAEEFERADGVDISRSMLRVARERCRRPERCVFHRNLAPDLAIFPDAAFSFIYSTIVLQHMEPRFSTAYIREFVRVLAQDGLLVFQLPSHRTVREPSSTDIRTHVGGPLPARACAAGLTVDSPAISARAGDRVMLRVSVENRSPEVWPALPDNRGRYQLNLANRWLNDRGELLQRDDERCPLPHDLAPGESADLLIGLRPPLVNRRYLVELDMVQENVGWFAERGSMPLRMVCDVSGGADGPAPTPIPAKAVAVEGPRFSERHPRAFAALRATGVRDVYWSARRGIDRVKARRDAVIRRRVHPAINWWQGLSIDARMEMHCVPRGEVIALIEECGARVVAVENEEMAGGYQSCRYWVRR